MARKRKRKLPENTANVLNQCLRLLRPPPPLTLSQWADTYRMLSQENSASPGRWKTSKAPYQRAIMDAMGDPRIRTVVIMSAAQIGKTAMLMNVLGYYMHYTPAPIMIVQPTVDMGEAFSKEFLTPMLRDTPVLSRLVDNRSRVSGNTILNKSFPGGHMTIIGANSPAGLASRPIKVLLCDEVDRYPPSAGEEGDPLLLAQKRQTTFWDKKTIIVSTPTIKGASRIEVEYLNSTQEEWNVPCPKCGHLQPLTWAGIVFDKDNLSAGIRFKCERCGEESSELEWKEASRDGVFIAANPMSSVRGFHLNSLASTFCGWEDMVSKFLKAKHELDLGDPEKMKTWVNTELGETWEEQGEQLEEDELINRKEVYGCTVPDDVLVLTAGVDVQDDRLEVEVVGWGVGKENWGIRYQKIFGDMLKEQVWMDLDSFLLTSFRKRDGTILHIACTCIDSGGHHANEVYKFCKERIERRVFAIKGMAGADRAFITNPSTNNRVKAPLFLLGVDTGKAIVYQRLKHTLKGPNYCHFPLEEEAGYDRQYFIGLTAEKQVVRFKQGRSVIRWEIKDNAHKRNEPLDCRNYATAALEILRPVLQKPEDVQTVRRRAVGRRTLSGGIR